MQELWIAAGVLLAIIFLVYGLYVRVIKTRNAALNALSTVDVQLKKRRDLIGNVLAIAKETMRQEIGLIERVTALRKQAGVEADPGDPDAVSEHLKVENVLGENMHRLFALAEAYPEAQFVAAMTKAQATYEEVEGHIAAARRFYNSAVEQLRNVVQIWPSSAIASMLSVKALPFFEMEPAEREPIQAADVFAS